VRRLDPGDRRVARVQITEPGLQLLKRIRSRKGAYLAARLATLPSDQLAVLRDATAVIERLLEEEGP
jgi:DNA-binding MarR family transcriptional regulator